jgi:symplekin
MESSDKTLTRFLLDLPEISEETLGMLREMCQNPDRHVLLPSAFKEVALANFGSPSRAIVGFTTLREIVNMRPPARASALQTLLDLTTHSGKP